MMLMIREQLMRRWWLYAIALFDYFMFALTGLHEPQRWSNHPQSYIYFMAMASDASMAQQRGRFRALFTMPVSPKQLGRSWWWVGFGIPNILLAGLTLGLAACCSHGYDELIYLIKSWWAGFSLIGLFGSALQGHRSKILTTTDLKLKFVFKTILFLSVICIVAFDENLIVKHPAIWALCTVVSLILTFVPWFRAEQFVNEIASGPIAQPQSVASNTLTALGEGNQGGLRSLCTRYILALGVGGIGINVTVAACASFIPALAPRLYTSQAVGSILPWILVLLSYTYVFSVMWFICRLRVLRSLPISTNVLTGLLVLVPLIVTPLISIVSQYVVSAIFGLPFSLSVQIELLPFILAAIVIPILVWRGLNLWIYLVYTTVFSVLANSAPANPYVMNVTGDICVAIFLAVSFIVTKRLVEGETRLYHAPVMDLPGRER